MCERAAERGPYVLLYVDDWFVTSKMIQDPDNDVIVGWCNTYKQHSFQKAKINMALSTLIRVCQKMRKKKYRNVLKQ